MLSEIKRPTTHYKDFILKRALVSWHILSMVLFVFTLSVCGALSSDADAGK